jgi:dienelactone hydrolase
MLNIGLVPCRLRFLLFVVLPLAASADDEAGRDYVRWMKSTLPIVESWNAWQEKTGRLPPDFESSASANFLPDPFRFHDGTEVRMPEDWAARRAEIRRLFEEHVVGSLPPKPTIERVVPVTETRADGYTVRTVRLEYGPGGAISSEVTLTLLDGEGRFPVLMGAGGPWKTPLVRRGYVVCEYPTSVDQPSDLPALYPEHDYATIGQRAWTAQVVVDYLLTQPEVDASRIAIYGYSRGGKMAVTAAAFDERIAAVVAGSTGVGGVLPWRLSGERGMGEGIESTTRMFPAWFAPQLRFFSGREDRLPVDANLLLALIAPRACLMEYGLNDEVANVWGIEQAYHSARSVYEAFDRPDRLGLLRVPGFHGANDIERCLDWLDIQFGRSARTWTNELLFPWSFAEWRERHGASVGLDTMPERRPDDTPATLAELERRNDGVRASISWILGKTPPTVAADAGPSFRRAPAGSPTHPVADPGRLGPDVPAWVIGRNSIEFGWSDPARAAADSRRIRIGPGFTGDLYFPTGTPEGKRLPTVVWLHGHSYPLGYMWVYRRDLHPVLALVQAGFAVLAFDQCGFGSRMDEIGPFYDRTPQWSQLGRMVADVRSAIDVLEREPIVDANDVSLFGYTIGGTVALHAAALDERVKRVVSVGGFTPMRTDIAERATGGLARLSVERPVAPRLGLFIGREQDVPYDYDELLAALAPRPVLVIQPTMDRDATPADVRAAVAKARASFALHGAADRLALDEPNDYLRLPSATQDRAIAWLKTHYIAP